MTTRVRTVDAARPEAEVMADAAAIIRRGGLVAFPTETVYGLGAAALDAEAVQRIFDAKGRPSTDPLIVHIAGVDHLATVAREVPPVALTLAQHYWPGPLTLVLPKHAVVPLVVTAGRDTVAVRVPAHPVARALIEACGVPIAAPSANRFSRPSPTTAAHVVDELQGRVDLVLDAGPATIGVESTIVDCSVSPPRLLRHGGVTREQLLDDVPDLLVVARSGDARESQAAPGQLLRHYAPSAPLTLVVGGETAVRTRLVDEARRLAATGERVGILAPEEDVLAVTPPLTALAASGRVLLQAYGRRAEPASAARDLFAALRALDARGPTVLLASGIGDEGIGAAVRDRLSRAAEGRVVVVTPAC
ncbi:MAG: threonylcarbamoyl-AMP synthase [Acidobacteria bacterium]|nr:threonylcarbamoyl-AMP synthase [Acidobacteriota bacterium]